MVCIGVIFKSTLLRHFQQISCARSFLFDWHIVAQTLPLVSLQAYTISIRAFLNRALILQRRDMLVTADDCIIG